MKIVFFGTPDFAAQVLHALLEHHIEIVAIVTQPDKVAGRNLQMKESAVKLLAKSRVPAIPVLQPVKASDPVFLEGLREIKADLFVVVAYGQILSRALLAIPPLGCINVHASLLPKYRGAAPIHRALTNGEGETGVSIQKMVYQLDAGDVIDEAKIDVPPDMTFPELERELCSLAKSLLLSVLGQYQRGIPEGKPQKESEVTYAPKITPEEAQIHWTEEATVLHNRIRGMSPRPGAWCWTLQGGVKKRLKLLRARLVPQVGAHGELLAFAKNRCVVAANGGALELIQVQPEGKKAMDIAEWIRGCQSPPAFVSG